MASPSLQSDPWATPSPHVPLPPPTVLPLQADVADQWDRFALEHRKGTFFHLLGWKRVIEKTFGYEACYFVAQRGGRLTGIAPFFFVSNWVIGRCLLSLPLAVYGGICAEDEASEQALLNQVKELALQRGVDFLELRNRKGGPFPGSHSNQRYVTFTTPLSPDPDANVKRLPKDTRYMIRKAERGGLRAQGDLDQLDKFYEIFALSMRRHGTPVFPQALFKNLAQEFPGQCDLLLVYAGAQAVTGVFSFLFRDTILPYYTGAGPLAPGLAANNFMYAELMKRASVAGMRNFDFGRSKKGTGAYAFKSQWSMQVEPLDYQIFLVRRKTVPNFSPVNPKFELATRVWKRLPLSLTKWIGPRVVRWFP